MLLRALLKAAAEEPDGSIARWLARAMLIIIAVAVLPGIVILVAVGFMLLGPGLRLSNV